MKEHVVRTEVELFEWVARGEALPMNEHFGRRLESLLGEAKKSGDCIEVNAEDFDAMGREAQELARNQK